MTVRLIDADRLKSYIDCGHLRPPTEVCFSELDVCNMIDKAPTVSAEAVQGWIPCSERLPSNDGCVLVTIDDAIEFGKYKDGEWSIWVCEHWDEWEAKGVDAWMPLPEPYKGGEDE